jgi:hypothetical protein
MVQWVNRLLPDQGRGSSVCVLRMHPLSQWNRVCPVSAVLLQWWPRRDPWSPDMIGPLALATGCFSHPFCLVPFSLQATDQCYILLGSHNAQTHYWGGGAVELLHSHTTTQSYWSSGSTVCFHPGGHWFASQGCTHSHNGTRFLLLALSCYNADWWTNSNTAEN